MIGVNYLSHFYLAELLINELIKSKGRIVVLSSEAHTFVKVKPNIKEYFYVDEKKSGFSDSFQTYCVSKLFNIYQTSTLHKKYNDKGVIVNSLHPGKLIF